MEEKSGCLPVILLLLIALYASIAVTGDLGDLYNSKVAEATIIITDNEKETGTDVNNVSDANFLYAGLVLSVESLEGPKKVTDSSTRLVYATAFGETDLRYHLRLKGGKFMPTTLDFSTNFLYNYSYIINTPSKLAHNIKADFILKDENSKGLTGFAQKVSMYVFIIWDVLHAITGIAIAIPMLFLGCILGLLFHPIDSLLNLIPVVKQMFVTTWHAINYIGNLFK